MLTISESDIRQAVSMPDAVNAVEAAFAALARGDVDTSSPSNLDIPESPGEIHIRAAHVKRSPYAVIKVAMGFWENRSKGLPTGDGLMLVLDAQTGAPRAMLLDHGFLTELRTGAAGAVAAKHLARATLRKIALIGAGEQAPFQIRGLAVVRQLAPIAVWSRNPAHAARLAAELWSEFGIPADAAASVESAVRGADLIITVTPSHLPLVREEWVSPGVHVTAVGSDGPSKQELAVEVLGRADLVVADRLEQCLALGEIHHAVAAGAMRADQAVELGDVVLGRVPGRTSADQITVADLTGLGVQDAAIAALAFERLESGSRRLPEPEWR